MVYKVEDQCMEAGETTYSVMEWVTCWSHLGHTLHGCVCCSVGGIHLCTMSCIYRVHNIIESSSLNLDSLDSLIDEYLFSL